MGLKEAMKQEGVSIEGLAAETGMQGAQIAGYRSGGRTMGWGTAIKLAQALDFAATPRDIMLANNGEALKRAAHRGDAEGVIRVSKSIISNVSKSGSTDDGTEEMLEDLTDFAVKFAQEHGGPFAADDYVSFDGRDRMGRRVEPLDRDDEDEDDEDDPYGYALEGRDSRGNRR